MNAPSSLDDVEFEEAMTVQQESKEPSSIVVPKSDIEVKIASTPNEWEQAFALTSQAYREAGLEESVMAGQVRFTVFHALPTTVTFVAKKKDQVVLTMTLVSDAQLGLPLDTIYGAELDQMRLEGRKLGEVICLADVRMGGVGFYEVMLTTIKLMMNYHVSQGGDTWTIVCHPNHTCFYTRIFGFRVLSPGIRRYPAVQYRPAQASFLTRPMMQENAPQVYEQIFGNPLPSSVLKAKRLPTALISEFAVRSPMYHRGGNDKVY